MSENVNISNSYENNEELLQKFPVKNPTEVHTKLEHDIQNRLLNGFENWNRGFDAWKAWGDILYTKDSIYNVHGARLTLAQYQAAMNIVLARTRIDMGQFRNMIIRDNWCAIHYDIFTYVGDRVMPGSVMEFVDFKDYGPELGVRVKEGWGGPRDKGFTGMAMFRGEEEKKIQDQQFAELIAYQIPDTDDLKAKYPVLHPTTDDSDMADEMRDILLKDFDAWNQGIENWKQSADSLYRADALCVLPDGTKYDLAGFEAAMEQLTATTEIEKKYYDSILISGDWAAIHYRCVKTDKATGEQTPADSMEFYRFEKNDDGLKIAEVWTK